MITVQGILDNSNKGLMIGNSSLGAIVFGEHFLSISLDKIDLWDERMPKEFKNPFFNYANLEKLLKEDYKKAFELFDKCYLHPYPTKINAGLIKTNIATSANDVGYIDPYKAEVTYKATNTTLNAYIDANQDVIVIKSNQHFDFEVDMPEYFYKKISEGGLNYPQAIQNKGNDFLVVKQPMYKAKSFHIVIYIKDNYLFVTVAKNENIGKSKELLINYSSNLKENYQKHLKTVHKFFAQSSIKTPDEEINNYYDLGKYYFFANSSKKCPVTTQGVWTQYNGSLPPWKSDLHNDLNVQLSYEPFFKTGNYKEAKVLLNYLNKNKKRFEKNAKEFLLTDGLYVPGVMTQKGEPLGGWPQYALSLCCQIWLMNSFVFYYEYTKDIKYLKEVFFPFLKEMEQGIRNYLVEDEEGKLVLGLHSTPEFFEDAPQSIFEYQTNFEITCLTFLYSKLVLYSKLIDSDASFYQRQLNKIRPLYRNDNNELVVSKNVEFNVSHRHFSHMLCYKNVPIYDFYLVKDNLKIDLSKLINQSTDNWVGFSFTEYADFVSLVNDGEEAYRYLKIFISNFTHPNGFHMNNDYKEYKYSKMDCYVFTLEANFSLVNAVDDMLLQNFDNKVTIFPALPKNFVQKGVSFKNLRIHGDHKVSAKKRKNNFSFSIKMKTRDTILLENNFADNPILIVDGTEKKYLSNIGDFIEVSATKSIIYKSF